jgi:hypothetical protein
VYNVISQSTPGAWILFCLEQRSTTAFN